MLKDMSHPEQAGNPVGDVPPPPPSWDYPPPGAYSPQLGYPPPPGFYHDPTAYRDPTAPYGRDQLTGQPLSDKSKVIAGLLQLIGVFGLVGFGRIYLGQTGYGIIQLVVGILTLRDRGGHLGDHRRRPDLLRQRDRQGRSPATRWNLTPHPDLTPRRRSCAPRVGRTGQPALRWSA